jgi:hypothetical protein
MCSGCQYINWRHISFWRLVNLKKKNLILFLGFCFLGEELWRILVCCLSLMIGGKVHVY